MNIDPARDIAAVILTHFHHDHTGGLDHFPHNRIIAPRACYEASKGLKGKLMGCLPQRWPIWFKPDLITSKYAVGRAVFIDIPDHQGRPNIHGADPRL